MLLLILQPAYFVTFSVLNKVKRKENINSKIKYVIEGLNFLPVVTKFTHFRFTRSKCKVQTKSKDQIKQFF